jgi:hypothetical protein
MDKRKLKRLERAAILAKIRQIEAELLNTEYVPPTLQDLEEIRQWVPPAVFNDLFGEAYQQLIGE